MAVSERSHASHSLHVNMCIYICKETMYTYLYTRDMIPSDHALKTCTASSTHGRQQKTSAKLRTAKHIQDRHAH